MDPAIKKVAIVIACALIVVLGLILVTQSADSKEAAVATESSQTQAAETVEQEAQNQETKEANADDMPAEEAKTSEASKTNEAPENMNEAAQEEVMYEGALAGLSEDEIAKMALAEEQGTARSETTGIETAVD